MPIGFEAVKWPPQSCPPSSDLNNMNNHLHNTECCSWSQMKLRRQTQEVKKSRSHEEEESKKVEIQSDRLTEETIERGDSIKISNNCNNLLNSSKFLVLVVILLLFIADLSDGCSSRSTPKPRSRNSQTQSAMRPNITFQTYACPPAYAAWYCLNGATCFTVKIADSILYNCECADGYMGQRCEFKDLDGSYLPAREKLLLLKEAASHYGGPVLLLALIVIVLAAVLSAVFTKIRTKNKLIKASSRISREEFVEAAIQSHQDLTPTDNNNINRYSSSYCAGHDTSSMASSLCSLNSVISNTSEIQSISYGLSAANSNSFSTPKEPTIHNAPRSKGRGLRGCSISSGESGFYGSASTII